MWRIVNTDNFGGDYPDEKFVGPEFEGEAEAQKFADEINEHYGEHSSRYYKVVEMPYELQPGLEP